MGDSRRPWLAALLSVQPGLGHVYLHEWLRAASWLALWGATLVVAAQAPVDGLELAEPVAYVAALANLPAAAAAALLVTTTFCMVDAYLLARRRTASADAGPSCPACGGELDESLEFCHWCTERLS
jgi:hypothetical protein